MITKFDKKGIICCSKHGKITPIDCSCLRNRSCKSCVIFESLKEIPLEKNDKKNNISLDKSNR